MKCDRIQQNERSLFHVLFDIHHWKFGKLKHFLPKKNNFRFFEWSNKWISFFFSSNIRWGNRYLNKIGKCWCDFYFVSFSNIEDTNKNEHWYFQVLWHHFSNWKGSQNRISLRILVEELNELHNWKIENKFNFIYFLMFYKFN